MTSPEINANQESVVTFGYRRPQLQRQDWVSLNGAWRFTCDDQRSFAHPADIGAWPLLIRPDYALSRRPGEGRGPVVLASAVTGYRPSPV